MVCVRAYAPTHTIFREFLAKPEQIQENIVFMVRIAYNDGRTNIPVHKGEA